MFKIKNFTKPCYLLFNISVEMTSSFSTNLGFDEFKIKLLNFQIKPLLITKTSYYVTNNPFICCFHKYNLLVY